MWWKKNKWKVIVPVLVLAVLAGAFWYGGGAPGMQGWSVKGNTHTTGAEAETVTLEETDTRAEAEPVGTAGETAPVSVETEETATPVNAPAEEPEPPAETEKSPSQEEEPAEETAEPEEALPEEESTAEENPGPEETTEAETPEEPEMPTEPEALVEPEPSAASEEQTIEDRPGGLEGGMTVEEKLDAAEELAGASSPGVEAGSESYAESQGMVIDPNTGKDRYMTDPVPEGKPIPVEPQDAVITDVAHTCTISISCATILDNMAWLDPEKVELVPEDGWILEPTAVTYYEGESVFNVLQRTCKQNRIHMEFENTPIYNSAYIEGINNLYEFDCGELSGWMYKVNDWFPNYGCSRYQLHEGDVICWVYTCNLGIDVGGYYAVGG